MKNSKTVIIFLIIIFSIQSCNKNNLETEIKLEKDFKDSIKKYKAVKFDFEEDGLIQQNNYFSNSKLKFLTLRYGGETNIRTEKYIFDVRTDKINTLYLRVENHDREENIESNFTDTIRIIDFHNKTVSTFVDDKLLSLKKDNKLLNNDFIQAYKVKKITEEKCNSTQK